MKNILLPLLLLLIVVHMPSHAQSSGQSARVSMGTVEKADAVTLQNTGKGGSAGTVAGAAVGYNIGSGNSSSKKRRRAIIGGAIGGAMGSSGTTPGMQYTVKFTDGNSVIVVSDQVHIKVGECVSVEESRGMTNIRKQDSAACNPIVKEAVTDLKDELAEDADECAQVRQELLAAKTTDEVEIATAKAKILCN